MRFLHCADIHLDMPFCSPGMSFEMSSERRDDLKETFRTIIQTAKKENVDAVLISGDLYEHDYVKKSTLTFVNECFKEIPEIRVFIVPGNHDPNTVNSFYNNFKWAENVSILTNENPYVVLEDLKTCIYGVGFRNFYEEKSLIYELKPGKQEYVNILMAHGTVDMNIKKSMYNPMDSSNLICLGMDYIALGHFHNRIENMGGYGIIYNPGSPEPLGFDEPGDHGIFLGEIIRTESGDKKLNLSFVKTNRKSYENIEVNIDGAGSDQQVVENLRKTIKPEEFRDKLVCITLKGYVNPDYKVSAYRVLSNLRDECFYMKLKDETKPDYDFDRIMNEPGIKGVFTRKLVDLMEKTSDEYEKKMLQKALYYGIEALEHGSVRITEG
ncbi:MAG: DNA repair exonuclease [Clostridia bacterium]|nr:DNA repair exonuclease [Clostridia bacterium]